VTSSERLKAVPDVPTMAETGFPDQESIFAVGIMAPAGTPRDIVDLWYREVVRVMEMPDVMDRLAAIGFNPIANSPDEFGAWIKTEIPRWAKVIREANIQRIE
jgi:tripartite-type tricarboxylate transporter receptor subunit TctC